MEMREVRVYDGDFPTMEQLMSGDPNAKFPNEVWLQQVHPGEFAVRYKDFKTGLARNPAGEHVQSSEICRVFSTLVEARADSRKVVSDHWGVRCFIYDHTGAEVDAICNTKEVTKFAAAAYAGILLWIGFSTLAGMSLIWMLYRIVLLLLDSSLNSHPPHPVSGWLYWISFASVGLLSAILAWYLRIQFIVQRTASRMRSTFQSAISAEDRKRFEEMNTLYGSKDPADRERFLKLSVEYHAKLRETLKK